MSLKMKIQMIYARIRYWRKLKKEMPKIDEYIRTHYKKESN